MKRIFHLVMIGLLLSAAAWAQTTDTPTTPDEPAKAWDFSLSVSGYIIPDQQGYASPVFTADHKHLHLEARYNYETMHTGSAWIGYNFNFGKKVEFSVTPMVGAVLGDMTGVAPGYTASIDYNKIAFWTSGEFVFDTNTKKGNFFYNWSELSYHIKDWIRAGAVIQRTKAYQKPLDLQRGFLVGVSHKRANFTTYVFNAGWTDPTVVLTLGFEF
jgi:hypothetical protein